MGGPDAFGGEGGPVYDGGWHVEAEVVGWRHEQGFPVVAGDLDEVVKVLGGKPTEGDFDGGVGPQHSAPDGAPASFGGRLGVQDGGGEDAGPGGIRHEFG